MGNSLAVQWLGLCTSTAGGSIPGRGTKTPQAEGHGQNKTKQINKGHYQESEKRTHRMGENICKSHI